MENISEEEVKEKIVVETSSKYQDTLVFFVNGELSANVSKQYSGCMLCGEMCFVQIVFIWHMNTYHI